MMSETDDLADAVVGGVVEDKDDLYFQRFNQMQGKFLKTLVNREVIEEYKNHPMGQHSEPLERLLIYFRSLPMENRYAIKRIEPGPTYKLIAFSSERGKAPKVLQDQEYTNVEDAYHGVFMKYINELVSS